MYRLDDDLFVFQSSMWQTNSVVYRNQAAEIVVDPTYFPVEIKVIANAVQKSRAFQKLLIFTHSDFDHIVGYQDFPGYKKVAHQTFKNADRDAQLLQLNELDDIYYVRRDKEFVFPDIDIYADDRTVLPLAHDNLVIIHAPGHTEDGIFIVSEAKKLIISGDYISDLEFPFVYYGFKEYLETLKKARNLIKEFNIEQVIPGHGDFATSSKDILFRIDSDTAYLEEIVVRVTDYCAKGFTRKEILEVTKDMSFRGEIITGALIKMHMENIKKAVKEVTG